MTTFAGQWGPEPFIDLQGNRRPDPEVFVYEDDGTTLASLYTDRTKATALANPLPIGVPQGSPGLDTQANGSFFGDPGSYLQVVTYAGVEVYRGVITIDPDPDEVEAALDHGGDATGAHTASAVALVAVPGMAATDVQEAVEELDAADALEASARAAADSSLAGDLSDETVARVAGDSAETTARNTAVGTLIPLAQKGAADGVATLGPDGKLPSAQVPALALSEFLGTVASEAAMLALVGQRGDWTVRTDLDPDRMFLLLTDDPTQVGNWQEITAAGAVVSVNGLTGAVVLPSDGAAGTASLRTLGTGPTQALPGNHPVALAADVALKVAKAGDTMTGSLALTSTAAGGTTSDSTNRLTLESYQNLLNGPFGESIRFLAMAPGSYQHLAWWFATDPSLAPDEDTNPLRTMVWCGAHYASQFTGEDPHGHWAVEVPGSDMQLRTRFQVPWIDQATGNPGVDKTNIRVTHADLTLHTYAQDDVSGRNPVLRIAASVATGEKAVEFSVDPAGPVTARRWHVLMDATAEAGGNAGSNLVIRRYEDDGDVLGTALYINRQTGHATFGTAADISAAVGAQWGGTNTHGFYAQPTALSSGFAAYAAKLLLSSDRFLQSLVAAEANARFVMLADGAMEFGDGASARDTTLYRSAADTLKTDDSFIITRNLRMNSASAGGGVGIIGIANASTLPSFNPTGGGVLYVEAGVLKYRSSSGVIFNTTQQAAVAAPTGGIVIDAEARTAIAALTARLQTAGLIA